MNQGQFAGKLKKFLPLAILLAGLGLFFALGLHERFTFSWLAGNYAGIKSMVADQRLLAWFAFFALYAVCTAFSLPIAVLLTLAGGAILGWPAVGLIVAGATLGSYALFLAARGAFAETLAERAGPFMSKIKEGFDQSPFFWLLALRLVPAFPFWAVNIAPALLGMKSRDYLLATAIGIIPGTAIYVWVGRGFDIILALGETPNLEQLTDWRIVTPLAFLGLLALVPVAVQTFRRGKS